QGITYNAYINNLRINHFMKLYSEAIAAEKTIIVQQLAKDSGFRSYSTFSLAFKQKMGQSVTVWMQNATM
ncbi:MAG: AraC family transcriptional regulator, partial [Elusimicrobiaceae bacterium]|nr:AraC family transcriptional regulator [Elusimicrobiaceae bacterium]